MREMRHSGMAFALQFFAFELAHINQASTENAVARQQINANQCRNSVRSLQTYPRSRDNERNTVASIVEACFVGPEWSVHTNCVVKRVVAS